MALKISGVGMGRTGTASLKVALEDLNLGNCYHMTEVMKNPDCIQDWIDAADGNPDWERIFENYTATVDNPGCGFWRELCDYYPQAKVILTTRDAEKWFDSTNETLRHATHADTILVRKCSAPGMIHADVIACDGDQLGSPQIDTKALIS